MQRLHGIAFRLKDNLWRAPAYGALAYVVAWWYAFWTWYVPLQDAMLGNPSGIVVVVDVYSQPISLLFITVGLFAMLLCAFIAYVVVFHK